eukprot:CAMPEP_0174900754 /NCGR_PEP_ID=MMETSP0167-20121228/32504_1 /TAXON_ID=38298 /ORGANISM="Rhodella maculata, Strain CCMP736" /LENGTH=97 /DNA_ID=CAMNT_0016142251 /DNA_START=35 /DNA_END=324 /DNA_ORIENTATION=+
MAYISEIQHQSLFPGLFEPYETSYAATLADFALLVETIPPLDSDQDFHMLLNEPLLPLNFTGPFLAPLSSHLPLPEPSKPLALDTLHFTPPPQPLPP